MLKIHFMGDITVRHIIQKKTVNILKHLKHLL